MGYGRIKRHVYVSTAKFLKYVWPFYNIMHERVNSTVYRNLEKTTVGKKGFASNGKISKENQILQTSSNFLTKELSQKKRMKGLQQEE